MASGSAMQQDSLLVSLAGVGTSVLPPLAHFGFGVKKQIKRQPMAGELAPEGPARTQVRDGRSSGRSIIQGGFWSWHLQVVILDELSHGNQSKPGKEEGAGQLARTNIALNWK